MLFQSAQFFVFFPCVALVYFSLRGRWAVSWLLLASIIFYGMLIPAYLLVIGGLILVDYAAGRWIERSAGGRRRVALIVSVVANLGVLFAFKYYNFFLTNLEGAGLGSALLPHVAWALPLGLSFHTFQSLSYVIEVYRGRQPAERDLGIFALYVMFFPQMVAGPIERPQHLLAQFHRLPAFNGPQAVSGLRLMLWGLAKKLVLADRLALYVDPVFGAPGQFAGNQLLIAAVLYAFQIYFDFSGYSNIAQGAARILGFELVDNFNQPYGAASLQDFWRRWHMSLSSWFRDYVYFPLGGNRGGRARQAVNLMVTFLLSGIWHGAQWTFVAWGVLHGILLVLENALRGGWPGAARVPRFFGIIVTFVLVDVGWIIFRSPSLSFAGQYLRAIGSRLEWPAWRHMVVPGFVPGDMVIVGVTGCLCLGLERRALAAGRPGETAPLRLAWVPDACLASLLIVAGLYTWSTYIYFQF